MTFNLFPTKAERVRNIDNLKKIASKFYNQLINDDFYKTLSKKEQQSVLKNLFSDNAQEVISKEKMLAFEPNKSLRDIFCHFFGMNENWKWGRNIGGMIMVHSPEYPTYFIPAYTQASATGDASELKKGEGPRGLITGALEGIAIGALVSGEHLKPREMIPYIILGAGLQLFSSKVFPWIGEKMGRHVYHKRQREIAQQQVVTEKPVAQPNVSEPKFTGKNPYYTFSCNRMKI